jgi:hypothetical protein
MILVSLPCNPGSNALPAELIEKKIPVENYSGRKEFFNKIKYRELGGP